MIRAVPVSSEDRLVGGIRMSHATAISSPAEGEAVQHRDHRRGNDSIARIMSSNGLLERSTWPLRSPGGIWVMSYPAQNASPLPRRMRQRVSSSGSRPAPPSTRPGSSGSARSSSRVGEGDGRDARPAPRSPSRPFFPFRLCRSRAHYNETEPGHRVPSRPHTVGQGGRAMTWNTPRT